MKPLEQKNKELLDTVKLMFAKETFLKKAHMFADEAFNDNASLRLIEKRESISNEMMDNLKMPNDIQQVLDKLAPVLKDVMSLEHSSLRHDSLDPNGYNEMVWEATDALQDSINTLVFLRKIESDRS